MMLGGENMQQRKNMREDIEEDDITIYSSEVREALLEDDELLPFEEAFMNGYEDAA